jgi:hypothetical protein
LYKNKNINGKEINICDLVAAAKASIMIENTCLFNIKKNIEIKKIVVGIISS